MLPLLMPQLREYFYVDPDIEKAYSLPRGAYWDPHVLEYEIDKVFRPSWLLLPKNILTDKQLQALKTRRHRVSFNFLGEEYYLRKRSAVAGNSPPHCSLNVCPHAGYPIVTQDIVDMGTSRFDLCGQHGLMLDEEGRFVSHPAFLPDDPRTERLCAPQFPMERWNDLLFLRTSESALSFKEIFGPMLDCIEKFPLEQFKYVPNENEERVLDGNWKLHASNYMDALHIKYIHHAPSGLHDMTWMDSYQTELYPHLSLQWVYAKNPKAGFDSEYLPERFRDLKHPDRKVFALWWFVPPNMTYNFYPWGLSINVYMPIPGHPTHVKFYWYHYVWDKEKHRQRDDLWLSSQVDAEDVEAMAQLQKNMRPGGNSAQRGRFGKIETGPHWLHRWIYCRMFEN